MSQIHHSLNSEQYRPMLVWDGERRFKEWHSAFLQYLQQFLRDRVLREQIKARQP